MNKKCLFSILLLLLAVLLSACATQNSVIPANFAKPVKHYPQYQLHEKTLANGLKIIVKEDHRAPVVVSQIWYRVGSSYEANGLTGLSHVLEHMMFKGTENLGPNEFSKIIAANGGRENAFTGRDYTAYFQTMERNRFPVSFRLEADRMRNLVLDAEEFAKEIKVVMEERRMRTEDNPQRLTFEQFNAAAYVNSPYNIPVIGWMQDLESMSIEDLQTWYEYWYAPNNATLVVAGDVTPEEIFAEAEKHFASIKPTRVPVPKPQKEIAQIGERRIMVKAPAQVPYLIMGYKVPTIINAKEKWEPYALDVLASVLDGGSSARFSEELIRVKQVATSVGAGYDAFTPRQEIYTFSGTPAQGKTVQELEAAIKEELEKLKNKPVTAKELSRVKAQTVAGKVYQKDSVFYSAMTIGMLETIGINWQLGEEYENNIKKVTAAQVQEVAKRYFIDDTLTVAVLDPQEITQSRVSNVGGGRHAR